MSNNRRILYIDDNKDHLMILQAMLKRDGYLCEISSRASEGLELALSEQFDLIFLDIQMPGMSGIELMPQLITRREETGMRIVAITADSSVFSSKSPQELGFDGYLSKPILPPDLSRIVKQMLATATG